MDSIRDEIAPAIIDAGVFKYIQINIHLQGDPSDMYTIVRGWNGLGYHADNFQKFIDKECAAG